EKQNSLFDLASANYRWPFIFAMTLPQLVSESSVMASLFAIFSMHFGHANSSLSGVSRSAAGEMIVPIPRPHCLHVVLSGNDINHALRATYSALELIWGNRSSMSGWVCTLGKIFVHVSPARNGSRNYALWV